MKTPVKALIIAALVLVALPIAAWTGTFLYWHLRIKGVIRALESSRSAVGGLGRSTKPVDLGPLLKAGCRSIPYLIRAMESSSSPEVMDVADYIIGGHVAMNPGMPVDHPRNYPRLTQWWERNRSKHNPWWRVWSGECR